MPTIRDMAKVKEGVVLSGLSGRAGNAVFVNTPSGTVLRDRPLVNDPNTPLQQATRINMARVGEVWKNLSLAQAAAWRNYALLEAGMSSGKSVPPNLVFTRLAMKFLQMHPGAPIPVVPPATIFPGDAVRFTVAFGLVRVGSGGSVCHSVQSSEFGLRTGAIEILADRDNAPGVVTEVLLQPLQSVHRRTYLSRYRTAGFFAFEAGVPVFVPTSASVVAVAVRFVCAATGQALSITELGIVGG
ncbi:MAG: hypothetical protein IT206_06515 [Fimbriimonadaceae bacterium]|nr:hypothetical protein [Fimbriimonadaceae bacterium]